MPHTTRAQAAAEIAAAAAEDEGDATEDQTRLPASVSRSNLGHRVAAMNAAANNMPIDAPYGQKTLRMKFLNEELAQFRSPQYPNGLCASENFICHSQNGLVVTELAAWKARALNEQRVTGDNTQDSNAHMNAACQAAQLALDENATLSKLSSAEKTRLLKEMELRQAEATRASEAAAMGLDQATMDARHARGPRLSPTQKAEEVFVYGAGGGGGPGPSGAGADAGAPSSSSAISQLVGVLQKESENTAKVARMAAETDQLREERLKTEGESKADLDKATLEAATQHRKRDLDIAEKRQEAEAEAGSAESKRRKAETDASASAAAISAAGVAASNEVIAKANAHAIQVKADVEALIAKANAHAIQVKADAEAAAIRAEAEQAAVRAQVALAQVRAQEAQTAMMMRMMEMIAKKE